MGNYEPGSPEGSRPGEFPAEGRRLGGARGKGVRRELPHGSRRAGKASRGRGSERAGKGARYFLAARERGKTLRALRL
jgi:hypothetical protein